VSGATVALSSDVLVRQWVDAFNVRDLEGMLERVDPEVRFHPLRLRGLDGSYDGHDDVQRWFARLSRSARCRRRGRVVLCGYVDSHSRAAWWRGRSREVRP
jgi:hypothetical protein